MLAKEFANCARKFYFLPQLIPDFLLSEANFIDLQFSTLTEKWYGESNKLVAAVFSLVSGRLYEICILI